MPELYAYLSIQVKCPSCGKQSAQMLREVIAQEGVGCAACSHGITFTDDEWAALVNEMRDHAEQIKTKLLRISN